MLLHTDHFHGSDLEQIEKIYHIRKEEITSFSANVNPLGLSDRLRNTLAAHLDVITAYPDREYTVLRNTIADYCGTSSGQIIVGNGSTELISLFIQTEKPKKALILGPTYSEYEREISLGGGTSLYYPLKESENFQLNISDFTSHLNESIDLLVICNPNNPTSTSVSLKDMRSIMDICKQHDIFVLIDETYIEFVSNYDEICAIPLTNYYNNLIIIRGISKFFAAPGLRLGYAISGNRDVIKNITTKQNPWAINSLAEIAGRLMFTDEEYITNTRKLIQSERIRICKQLDHISCLKYYEPSANFVLVRSLRNDLTAELFFDNAIREKMMIRNCSTFPFLDNHYIRFCFMSPGMNDKLLDCIERTCQ